MATLDFSSTGRPEPLTISIKRVGDNTERFQSRNGNTVSFSSVAGNDVAYVMEIVDAANKRTVANFTQSCQRPPDCQEGPDILEITSFNRASISYKFHGVNVQKIRREIRNNGVIVDISIDEPSSPNVNSPFKGPLANGNYDIYLFGESCYSGETPASRPFTITDGTDDLNWWPGFPRFDYNQAANKYRILIAVNKAGEYPYEIRDSLNNLEVGGNIYLTPGQIIDFTQFDPDTYTVKVGSLTSTLVIDSPPNECEEGPELTSVTSLSTTQTQFQFDGLGVYVIEWFIRNTSDVILHRGTIEPGGANVTITHPALAGGNYNLLIKGSSCTSETGIVDNLDFTVNVGSLTLGNIDVSQIDDGRYRLTVNFTGGTPNYIITVRTQGNSVIGTFPNTTGSPATITLPAGTTPQTVKVMVMDVNNAISENTNVVLPAPTPKLNFLQRDGYTFNPQKTPMVSDGVTYFIGSADQFNWDVEFVLPNGGLWDYIEKRVRKQVSGNFVEKSVSAATGQSQNYSVGSSTGAGSMWFPRNGNTITIDGLNVFKTAGTWEFRFIARKGGAGGAIVGQKTVIFTISSPPGPSGIFLYNRNGNAIGSEIAEIASVGSEFDKPTPHYDLVVKNYGGVSFSRHVIRFLLKVGNNFEPIHSNDKDFGSSRTTMSASDHSLFWHPTDLPPTSKPSLFQQAEQTWLVETSAMNGNTVVATRQAVFKFKVGGGQFSNPGLERKTIAGREYVMTNGLDFGARALSSGNMQLYLPATRQSINGQNTTYPWVYINHVRMHPDDLTAFKSGSGLAFPSAIHTVSIKWHSAAVANYDDVIDGGAAGNAYNLAGEQLQVSGGYSSMDDYFTFSIIGETILT